MRVRRVAGRGEAVGQKSAAMTQGARSLAFQAEGRGRGPRDQQPDTRLALPPAQRPAPPGPRHVRLFPPVGDLGDRPRCAGGSAAAPDQV